MDGSLQISRSDDSRPISIDEARQIVSRGGRPRTLADALERIAELDECVTQLSDQLRGGEVIFPKSLKLSQGRLRALIVAHGGMVSGH